MPPTLINCFKEFLFAAGIIIVLCYLCFISLFFLYSLNFLLLLFLSDVFSCFLLGYSPGTRHFPTFFLFPADKSAREL